MKKWLLYIIVFAVFIALAVGYMSLNRHFLREGPEVVKWLIPIVIAAIAIILHYFGKPLRPEKNESRNVAAIRCAISIALGVFLGYLLTMQGQRGFDITFWITIMSLGSVFSWCITQVNNKYKTTTHYPRDKRNLYL